jgi:hypothetical protein
MAGKRKEGDLVAPDIMEDAGERKRILNVLAQRRYRRFYVPNRELVFRAKPLQDREEKIECKPWKRNLKVLVRITSDL